MESAISLPHVPDDETLSRFILRSNHIRGDQTIKPDAFIPYPWPNLSVTRHSDLTIAELWAIGRTIAEQRPATLYGRADTKALTFRKHSLDLIPTRTPRNHVEVFAWPADKPSQKIIAQEIAAEATFISVSQDSR